MFYFQNNINSLTDMFNNVSNSNFIYNINKVFKYIINVKSHSIVFKINFYQNIILLKIIYFEIHLFSSNIHATLKIELGVSIRKG